MAIPGLTLTTSIGWVLGLIVLRVPWGPPNLPSWFSVSLFHSILLLCTWLFFGIDVVVNSSNSLFMAEPNYLGQWVARFGLLYQSAMFLVLRLFLLVRAKDLANFMSQLYHEPLHEIPTFRKSRLCLEACLTFLVHLLYLVLISIGLSNGSSVIERQAGVGWIGPVIGKTAYLVIFIIVEVISQGALENCVYSIVLRFSYYLHRIFDIFAYETVTMLEELGKTGDRVSLLEGDDEGGTGTNVVVVPDLVSESMGCKCIRREIHKRFRKIQRLFSAGDALLSPLCLTIATSGTVAFILAASKATVFWNERTIAFLAVDILRVLQSCCFLGIFEVGEQVHNKIENCKLKIYQAFVSISWENEHKIKLATVMDQIQHWKWRPTGGGFFNIDRKLAKGIMNLILTYVIIFFQLYRTMIQCLTYTGSSAANNNETSTLT